MRGFVFWRKDLEALFAVIFSISVSGFMSMGGRFATCLGWAEAWLLSAS
jgi:hypothetical protein